MFHLFSLTFLSTGRDTFHAHVLVRSLNNGIGNLFPLAAAWPIVYGRTCGNAAAGSIECNNSPEDACSTGDLAFPITLIK